MYIQKNPYIHFHLISIFPQMFDALSYYGITQKALSKNLWQISCYNPRDFSNNKFRKIDDRPFGGGAGMVMMAQPLENTVLHIQNLHGQMPKYLLSPQGVIWTQKQAQNLANQFAYLQIYAQQVSHIILVCGRYDGIDQRFIDQYITHEISMGNFILSGGELPAMQLMDSIIRLLPNALGNQQSAINDSFTQTNMLDYPQYTQPRIFNQSQVPNVLLQGHHAKIQAWRDKQAQLQTKQKRPELSK